MNSNNHDPETIIKQTADYTLQIPPIKETWRILITGITSIHGWPIFKLLKSILPQNRLFGIRPPSMTLPGGKNIIATCTTDSKTLSGIRDSFNPTHVIHCAGVCDLDLCEERPEWAKRLNQGGAQTIRRIFGDSCTIIYASTDLIFSGNNPPEKGYAEHHIPDPVSVAGKTYLLAEKEIGAIDKSCIIRLGLPIGKSITGDKGGLDWIEGRFRRNLVASLFHDEIRSCLRCSEIARVVLLLLVNGAFGIYHLGGTEQLSLHELGNIILKSGNYPPDLLKSWSRFEDTTGPPRIGNVSLDSSKLKQYINSLKQKGLEG